jgi:hypothetical protein
MVKIKLRDYTLGLIFLCIGAAASIGYSQESANDYVSPRQAVPRGTAPAMQVQLLSAGRQAKEYAVIFGEGDEAFSGLLAFAQTYHVTSAHFTAIGGLSKATLAWFDPQRKTSKRFLSIVRLKWFRCLATSRSTRENRWSICTWWWRLQTEAPEAAMFSPPSYHLPWKSWLQSIQSQCRSDLIRKTD